MLDAFVIEKIRREQERQDRARQPAQPELRIPEVPPLQQRPDPQDRDEREGGVVIVDFTI